MTNFAKIKAIIVDLDGTLLHTDKMVSEYSAGIFAACKKKGIRILVATARPLRTAEQYCKDIGADAVTVSNGARIFCGNQRMDYGICQETAVYVLNRLKGYSDLCITLETGTVAYSNKPIADYETVLADDLPGLAEAEGALKILVRLDSEKTLALVTKELPEELYYTISNGHLLQIMSKSATKWNGIQEMLSSFKISTSDAVYFGDDNDDVEPIEKCGVGIAVSNAIDEVKAHADYVAKTNDEDGVARFIAEMLLKE